MQALLVVEFCFYFAVRFEFGDGLEAAESEWTKGGCVYPENAALDAFEPDNGDATYDVGAVDFVDMVLDQLAADKAEKPRPVRVYAYDAGATDSPARHSPFQAHGVTV